MLVGPNTVELLGHYGGDETHALSAWTSTSRDLPDEKRSRIGAMLKQLAEAGHHTPFEKSTLHFLVCTDIATHIHLLKHRIAVPLNAESARYRELRDKGYVPLDWPEPERIALAEHIGTSTRLYHEALDNLVAMGYSRKRAKESARFFLPYASQITADVAFNWRSFWHFLTLRYSEAAQDEVRDIARQMLEAVRDLPGEPFLLTLRAFGLIDADGAMLRDPFQKGEFSFVPR